MSPLVESQPGWHTQLGELIKEIMALAYATGKLEVRPCDFCGIKIQHREMDLSLHPPINRIWHAIPHGCSKLPKVKKELPVI